FWAFITVIVAFGFIPVLFAYLPLKVAKGKEGFLDRAMKGIGIWICGWGKYAVLGISLFLAIWGCTYFNKITVGNAVPGSEILWPWHRYNVDSFRITFAMPRLNPLFIIAQGDEAQAVGINTALWRDVAELGRFLQKTPGMRVITTLNCLMSIPQRERATINNNPNWYFYPTDESQFRMLYKVAVNNAPPGTMDKYIDTDEQAMNIIIYCRDKTTETINIVMSRVTEYIQKYSKFGVRQQDVERHGVDKVIYWLHTHIFADKPEPLTEKPPIEGMPKAYYRLAAGTVGVQAAINECLEVYSLWTFIISLLTCYLMVVAVFRSWMCGFVCMLPIFISNALSFAVQCLSSPPIALTTATLPVASIGIGLGVDYGIYYVSRVIEEVRDHNRSLDDAVIEALGSTGKAIFYIGITLCSGIVFWFLSKMMFQAMMGLMLAIVLLVNMLGALFIIPAYISLFKPKFIVDAAKKI
ncbi:MAG: MMPL family transporter, partial [Pseudomonadota bacterium]